MNRFFLTFQRGSPFGDFAVQALMLLVFLTACAPAQTPLPATPVNNDSLPRPEDGGMVSGAVFIDSIKLLTMESYPPQFSLALTGNLPTPCHQLRVVVNPPDAEKNIYVEVYSVTAPDAICATMLQPFTKNIILGSFPSGHYTVWVNSEQVAEFDG
jgi:hypothetical protein